MTCLLQPITVSAVMSSLPLRPHSHSAHTERGLCSEQVDAPKIAKALELLTGPAINAGLPEGVPPLGQLGAGSEPEPEPEP